MERRRLQLESRARSPARSLRPRALAREPLAGFASVAPPAPSSSSSSRAACSCPGAGSRQGPGAEGKNPTVSESSLQARGGGAARGRLRRVALRRVEVRGAPGCGCNRRAGGGGPRFPARPSLASGAGIRVRPLPASWLLAGSSRALPGCEQESTPGSGALILKDLSKISIFFGVQVCPRIHPALQMTAGCVRGSGWREDKLLQKCAWAGGPRLGRLDTEGGGSARVCEGGLRSIGEVAPGTVDASWRERV